MQGSFQQRVCMKGLLNDCFSIFSMPLMISRTIFCILLTFAIPLRHILQSTHYFWLDNQKFRYLWMFRFWKRKMSLGKHTCQHNHRNLRKLHLGIFPYVSIYFCSPSYDILYYLFLLLLFFGLGCLFLLINFSTRVNGPVKFSDLLGLRWCRIIWNLMPFLS